MTNLLSIRQLYDKVLEVNFNAKSYSVRTIDGKELLGGFRKSNLYTVDLKKLTPSAICLLSKETLKQNLLWYHRLSHLSYANINKLAKASLVKGLLELKFEKE